MLDNRFISCKMRICFSQKELQSFSNSQVRFYQKYSDFVFKSLAKTSFQQFLSWMLKKENIKKEAIRLIQVKTLPLRSKNGKGVAGNCNLARGQIRIYPKTSKFCQLFRKKFGKDLLHFYAKNRARAALIHELLHLKYVKDETTVRELSKKYFHAYTKKRYNMKPHEFCIHAMVFDSRISEEAQSLNNSSKFAKNKETSSNKFKSKLRI